jgi:hypothetical protein
MYIVSQRSKIELSGHSFWKEIDHQLEDLTHQELMDLLEIDVGAHPNADEEDGCESEASQDDGSLGNDDVLEEGFLRP